MLYLRYILNCISIHAAREGGDDNQLNLRAALNGFQSTPPVKAATTMDMLLQQRVLISIHAAREGGDIRSYRLRLSNVNFNPRRP